MPSTSSIPINVHSPISVVCPECHAAIGAQCTTKVRDGSKFIETYHRCRIELFLQFLRIDRPHYKLYLHLDPWDSKLRLVVEADGMYLSEEEVVLLAQDLAQLHLQMLKQSNLFVQVSRSALPA